jgi:hypothetical protein
LLFAKAGLAETDAFAMEFLTYVGSVLVSLIGFAFFLTRRPLENQGTNGDQEH